MIWWVIFAIILIIIIVVISLMVGSGEVGSGEVGSGEVGSGEVAPRPDEIPSVPIPTMHTRCNQYTTCGGDLVCDYGCYRCKQKEGGNCAGDVDCDQGLQCVNWRCVQDGAPIPNQDEPIPIIPGPPKHIRWDLHDVGK